MLVLAFALCVANALSVNAQYLDTYTVPHGVLRFSFEPHLTQWENRFDADGALERIDVDFTSDSAGADFFPSLAPVQLAVRNIIGDSMYRTNAGAFTTVLDSDVRRFPFNFQYGLTDRITLTASIPVVTTRSLVNFTVDSANAEMGWNQIAAGQNATATSQIAMLLGELGASATALDNVISGGGLDCPSGPQCDSARGLVDRARAARTNLIGMTGVIDDFGTIAAVVPPFAPLGSSTAGQALLAALTSISVDMQGFGVPGLNATLPLPAARLSADDVQSVFAAMELGYNSFGLEFNKYRERLGDIELGARFGLVQSPSLRAVLSGTVRLPTALRESPDHFLDIGTGDKQTDVQMGIEAALEPGSVLSLAVAASYNLQLSDRLTRRVTSPHQPIALENTERMVSRNLGDEFRIAAFPALRFAQGFVVYGSIDYYEKFSDSFTGVTQQVGFEESSAPPLSLLEESTSMRRLTVGGGVHYRSTGRLQQSLPIEAGVHYLRASRGSGGFTPQTQSVNFYLRLFFRLFGRAAEPNAS